MDSYSAGYARKAQLGDAKSNDRRRLLTDRNAYIAYLESHVERFNEASVEVESLQDELRLLRGRLDDLEERFATSQRGVELVKVQMSEQLEAGQAERQDALDHMHRLESRALRLEQQLSERTMEADMARLRNELSLSVQEMGQRLDERLRFSRERFEERLQALQELSHDEAALVIREAQATCVRLADDALGAAETSQKKVEDVARNAFEAERRFEQLRLETEQLRSQLVTVQAELASRAEPSAPSGLESLEQRLASRMGHQVLQLSEVLQRVVQSQAALSQQCSGGKAKGRHGSRSMDSLRNSEPVSLRRRALNELYEELEELQRQPCYY